VAATVAAQEARTHANANANAVGLFPGQNDNGFITCGQTTGRGQSGGDRGRGQTVWGVAGVPPG